MDRLIPMSQESVMSWTVSNGYSLSDTKLLLMVTYFLCLSQSI